MSALEVGLNQQGSELKKELVLDLHNDNQYIEEIDNQSQLMTEFKQSQDYVVE